MSIKVKAQERNISFQKGVEKYAYVLQADLYSKLLDRPADDCPRTGFCNNAYPSSGDALDPKPFQGSYPRVVECTVPPRTRPTDPCQ